MNPEQKSLPQKERKIATSITKVHQSAGKEISIPMLNVWHQSLLVKSIGQDSLGTSRSAPVYIVSGGSKNKAIHFEAPPH